MQYHLNLVKDKQVGYSLPEPRSYEQAVAEEDDEYLEAYTVRVDEPYMTQ